MGRGGLVAIVGDGFVREMGKVCRYERGLAITKSSNPTLFTPFHVVHAYGIITQHSIT